MAEQDMSRIINNLSKISEKYGIKEFIKVEPGDDSCKANGEYSYINTSYICGSDRIEIGIYDNADLMIASFFHELGHITNAKEGVYNSEERAWKIGFKLAESYGYKFCSDTYDWANEQLTTYSNTNN